MKEQNNLKNKYIKYIVGAVLLLAIIILPFMNLRATAEPEGLSADMSRGISPENLPAGLSEESSEVLVIVPTALSSNIELAQDEVLVFHAQGKYLIVPTVEESNTITPAEWLAATTEYDANTTVSLPANVMATMRTIGGNVVIKSISGDLGSKLTLLETSDLTVDNSGGDYGISLGEFEMGSNMRDVMLETKLTVTAGVDAFIYTAPISFYAGSIVNVTGGNRGFKYEGEKEMWTPTIIYVKENSVIRATATGVNGIAAEVHGLQNEGGEFYADAPAGVGGVLSTSSISILSSLYDADMQIYPSKLIATSYEGKAIYIQGPGASLSIHGAGVSGITENGIAGISVESSMQASPYFDGVTNIESSVYGKAKTGFGIIVQDSFDNSTFPSGFLSATNTSIEGYVGEGMGISTYMMAVNADGDGPPVPVKATAELGIGLSTCSFYVSGNMLVEATSLGSTENHFQVYDSIPDSAGISVLSYFTINNSTLIAKAPISDPDSYGIHAELCTQEGQQSGYASFDTAKVEIEAGIGIYAGTNVYINSSTELNINTSGDGIRSKSLNIGTESVVNIKSTDGIGIYLGILREEIPAGMNQSGGFHLDTSIINIEAKTYGLFLNVTDSARIDGGVELNVNASGEDSTGLYISLVSYDFGPPYQRHYLEMNGLSNFNITADKHAIHLLNLELDLAGKIQATGGETPVLFEYDPLLSTRNGYDLNISGGELIAISRAVAPDAANRKAAVSIPEVIIAGGSLIESYEIPAENMLTASTPHHIYAMDMNITSPENYSWSSSDIPISVSAAGLVSPDASQETVITAVRTAELPGEVINISSIGTHKITVKARANYYELDFDVSGGVGPNHPPTQVAMGSSIDALTGVTKLGYQIDYWYDVSNNTRWDFATMPMPEKNLVLKISWRLAPFTAKYNANIDDSSVAGIPVDETVLYTSLVSEPPLNPTRDKHLFVAWYKDAGLTTKWDFTSDTMPPNDLILYAEWKVNVYAVTYEGRGGEPLEQVKEVTVGEVVPRPDVIPTRLAYKFLGWYKDPAATQPWIFGDVMQETNMILYAGWERTHWIVTFDAATSKPSDNPEHVLVPISGTLDLAPYQDGGNKEVKYAGNFSLGWVDEAGAPVKSVTPSADQKLTAKWIPVQQIMSASSDNVVIYKNESTQAAVEAAVGAKAQYTDLYGNVKTKDITLSWNPATIGASGVEKISYAVKDSSGNLVYSEKKAVLYVLNKPYLALGRTHVYITVGQWISAGGDEYRPLAYAEQANFEKQTIERAVVPIVFDKSLVDMRVVGEYDVTFTAKYTDFDGKVHVFEKTGILSVDPKEKPDPEDAFKRENREYWEAVAKVILQAKPGETWTVTVFNYKTGGSLETGTIAKNAGYDRMVIAEPGKYMFLTPHPLNRLKAEKTTMFEIRLPGRTWNFHGKDNKTSTGDVREEFPLKMNGTLNDERITKLLPAKTNQMQIEFDMNQAWFAEPVLTTFVNDALKESSAAGKALYMFHYNENTNELELVGKMTKQANGAYSIRMNGVYKYYVITAGMPSSLNIHLTNNTNPLDPGTLAELEQGIIDSGRNPVNEAIDTVATSGSNKPGEVQNAITGASHVLDDDQGKLNLIPIGLGSLGIALIGFFFFILLKRRKEDEEEKETKI